MPPGSEIRPDGLATWLAGVTIVNDLSARDVQLPQGQFYKGKSFRGFGPVGPGLVLLEPEEWARWPELHMRLAVNGKTRQDAYCREMIHHGGDADRARVGARSERRRPHRDRHASGLRGACARQARDVRPALRERSHEVAPVRSEEPQNSAYLRPGDRISATIRTDDGAIDLGEQTTLIAAS